MRSFSSYRKQCIGDSLNKYSARGSSQALFEMLRLDLIENSKLPELITESSIAKAEFNRFRKDYEVHSKIAFDQICNFAGSTFYDEVLKEADSVISTSANASSAFKALKNELKVKISQMVRELKDAVAQSASVHGINSPESEDDPAYGPAPQSGGSGPAPQSGGSGPAPQSGGSGPAPQSGGSGPAPQSGGSGPAPQSGGSGPAPQSGGSGPAPQSGQGFGHHFNGLMNSLKPKDGWLSGLGRVVGRPFRDIGRYIKKNWYDESCDLIESMLFEHSSQIIDLIDKFEKDVLSWIEKRTAEIAKDAGLELSQIATPLNQTNTSDNPDARPIDDTENYTAAQQAVAANVKDSPENKDIISNTTMKQALEVPENVASLKAALEGLNMAYSKSLHSSWGRGQKRKIGHEDLILHKDDQTYPSIEYPIDQYSNGQFSGQSTIGVNRLSLSTEIAIRIAEKIGLASEKTLNHLIRHTKGSKANPYFKELVSAIWKKIGDNAEMPKPAPTQELNAELILAYGRYLRKSRGEDVKDLTIDPESPEGQSQIQSQPEEMAAQKAPRGRPRKVINPVSDPTNNSPVDMPVEDPNQLPDSREIDSVPENKPQSDSQQRSQHYLNTLKEMSQDEPRLQELIAKYGERQIALFITNQLQDSDGYSGNEEKEFEELVLNPMADLLDKDKVKETEARYGLREKGSEAKVTEPEVSPEPEAKVTEPEVSPEPEAKVTEPEVSPEPEAKIAEPEVSPEPEAPEDDGYQIPKEAPPARVSSLSDFRNKKKPIEPVDPVKAKAKSLASYHQKIESMISDFEGDTDALSKKMLGDYFSLRAELIEKQNPELAKNAADIADQEVRKRQDEFMKQAEIDSAGAIKDLKLDLFKLKQQSIGLSDEDISSVSKNESFNDKVEKYKRMIKESSLKPSSSDLRKKLGIG